MRRAGVEPAKPGISVQCVCRFTTGACLVALLLCRRRCLIESLPLICGPSRRFVAWTKGGRGCPRLDGEAPRVPRRARIRHSSSASFGAPGGSRTRNHSPESESGAFTSLTTDACSSPTGDGRDHKSETTIQSINEKVRQSGWLDLPQRPPAPEAGVLLAELHPEKARAESRQAIATDCSAAFASPESGEGWIRTTVASRRQTRSNPALYFAQRYIRRTRRQVKPFNELFIR